MVSVVKSSGTSGSHSPDTPLSCHPPLFYVCTRRWSCPSLTAADVRPAAEIAAYRAFSTNVCAEIEQQMNLGAPPCSPGVASSTPPYDVESITRGGIAAGERKYEGLDGGVGLAADTPTSNAESVGSRKAPHPRVFPEQGRPTPIDDGQTADSPKRAIERDRYGDDGGDSADASVGSTFLTDGRRRGSHDCVDCVDCGDDVDRRQQKKQTSGPGSNSTSGYGAPSANRRVVGDGGNNAGGDYDTKDGGRQKLGDGGGQQDRATRFDINSAVSDAIAGESATEGGGIVGVKVGGGARKGPGRLWDRGRSPSDSSDKQRMTLTSAR